MAGGSPLIWGGSQRARDRWPGCTNPERLSPGALTAAAKAPGPDVNFRCRRENGKAAARVDQSLACG